MRREVQRNKIKIAQSNEYVEKYHKVESNYNNKLVVSSLNQL